MDLVAENERLRASIAAQRADLAARDAELEVRNAELAVRDADVVALRRENDELRVRVESAEDVASRLQREVDRLRRQILGPSSERVVDLGQLVLPIPPASPSEAATGRTTAEERNLDRPKRKGRAKGGRRKVEDMDHLRTILHEQRVEDRRCPCGCGAFAKTIGHDISWRLERIPAEYVRHKIVVEKVVFPDHAGGAQPAVLTASSPVPYALAKALCGNQLLADVVVDKYADHLPLHRQADRFRREGFDLSRQTLCGWMMQLAELVAPIVNWMAVGVRGGSWLRADATGMPVMDEGRTKGRAHHGHLWAWGDYDTVIFTYTPDKRAETVLALFEGFVGVVLIDGASDFNLLEKSDGVTRAGCWAHARRMLYEALPYDARLARTGLTAIRQLFLGERVVLAAPLAERLALRKELCEPVLVGLRRWVDDELPRQIPGSPGRKALQYLDNQWQRLVVFLQHAEIACHNNATERDLRRPVKGRVNYLFSGSPRGAAAAATFYTLIGTCLLQGTDPRRYFVDILGRLDEPPSRLTPQAVREAWESGLTSE